MTAPKRRALTVQERGSVLDQNLIRMTALNGRVETRADSSAVVVNGKPVNHVLHVLLSVFLCTLWVPAWMLLTATGGERRTTVTVDQYGTVQQVKAPMEVHRIVLMVLGGLWAVMILWFFGSCSAAMGK